MTMHIGNLTSILFLCLDNNISMPNEPNKHNFFKKVRLSIGLIPIKVKKIGEATYSTFFKVMLDVREFFYKFRCYFSFLSIFISKLML